MSKIIYYFRCESCKQECREVEKEIESCYYEPQNYNGTGYETVTIFESECCGSATYQCRTLPMSKAGKDRLLARWKQIGNAEIINHIENVLPYIGEAQ